MIFSLYRVERQFFQKGIRPWVTNHLARDWLIPAIQIQQQKVKLESCTCTTVQFVVLNVVPLVLLTETISLQWNVAILVSSIRRVSRYQKGISFMKCRHCGKQIRFRGVRFMFQTLVHFGRCICAEYAYMVRRGSWEMIELERNK